MIHQLLELVDVLLSIALCWWAVEMARAARARRRAVADARIAVAAEIRGATLNTIAEVVVRRINAVNRSKA